MSQPAEPNKSDVLWMRLALEEAELASTHGDVPVGAVVVLEGSVIARAHNRREIDQDPTAHAEILALRQAAERIGHWRVEADLYVTLEPCAMCAGALVNARVRRVIYGATDPKAGAIDSLFGVGVGKELNHQLSVTRGLLADEAADKLRAFFQKLRAEGQK